MVPGKAIAWSTDAVWLNAEEEGNVQGAEGGVGAHVPMHLCPQCSKKWGKCLAHQGVGGAPTGLMQQDGKHPWDGYRRGKHPLTSVAGCLGGLGLKLVLLTGHVAPDH